MNFVEDQGFMTDAELAYAAIRHDIIHNRLPPGHKLKVAELRETYKVGSAPLREALSRLIGDRLVVQQSQRGFRVKQTSAEDVQDVGRIRVMLECEALRDSLAKGDDEWEARVVASYHRLSLVERRERDEEQLDELEARNTDFHEALVSASPSWWLLELRRQVYAHHERYRYLSRTTGGSGRDTPAEHAAIFDAAIRRDAKTTCALMTKHIDLTTDTALRALADQAKGD